ncbi:hypothetical protein OHA98_42325 [Streptomyces sp. NBC_00654]|uniref:hypothetical protein n=1 Tax=Streptomyces sp. NBC_00654 TaxID=2975799 RepID=UPI00224DDED6|nr:hypothetical protein [Streptomyces sp. NBC_00654]MCX4971233.1 hypothetical protein [Streptomyces sp. NBC_00654]MCX4971238.1 hypothetical protein [Streptomyces sp. NBC_00654]
MRQADQRILARDWRLTPSAVRDVAAAASAGGAESFTTASPVRFFTLSIPDGIKGIWNISSPEKMIDIPNECKLRG